MTTYIPIVNVRFSSSGDIITSQGGVAKTNGKEWLAGSTIYQLQQNGFSDLNKTLKNLTPGDVTDETSKAFIPNSIDVYEKAMKNIFTYNSTSPGKTQIIFVGTTTGLDSLIQEYNKMVSLRNSMNAKLKNIYEMNGTINSDNTYEYNNSMYTNTLVAILATSLLYMVFIHLK
jgi:hypothetical protein